MYTVRCSCLYLQGRNLLRDRILRTEPVWQLDLASGACAQYLFHNPKAISSSAMDNITDIDAETQMTLVLWILVIKLLYSLGYTKPWH